MATTVSTLVAYAALVFAQSGIVLAPGNRVVSMQLPDGAFGHENASLSVDIDGFDVTPYARVDGNTLIVELDIPLDQGQHSFALYLFHANGDADVLVDGLIEAPKVVGGNWDLTTTLQANYRTSEKPSADYAGINELGGSGGLSFVGEHVSGSMSLNAKADVIYDSTGGLVDEKWLLPDFGASVKWDGDSASGGITGGVVKVGGEDLLFSAFQRRGITLGGSAASNRINVNAFTVGSNVVSAFASPYVLYSASDGRSRGVTGSVNIIDKHLQLAAGFIDGNSTLAGDGFNLQNDTTMYGGDSWNVALDARFKEGGVWLHVEHAESDFDADGFGLGIGAQRDDATQVSLQVSSQGSIGSGPFEYWSASLQQKRVGRDFYSIGNLALPGNIEVLSAYLQAGFTSFSIDLDLAREETNPSSNPLLPTQQFDRTGVSLAYAPASLNPENKLWAALGAPSISGWVYRLESGMPESDIALAGYDVDNATDDIGVALTFAREKLTWSLQYGLVDYEDSSLPVLDNGFLIYEPPSDSKNRQTTVQASWVPGERVSIDAHLQRNSFEETDYGYDYETTNFGLSGNVILIPEKLSLYASFSRGRDRNRFGDPQFADEDLRSNFSSLQLNWFVREAGESSPGLNLFLKGSYGRSEDIGFMIDADFWTVYIGGELNWAGSKQ